MGIKLSVTHHSAPFSKLKLTNLLIQHNYQFNNNRKNSFLYCHSNKIKNNTNIILFCAKTRTMGQYEGYYDALTNVSFSPSCNYEISEDETISNLTIITTQTSEENDKYL